MTKITGAKPRKKYDPLNKKGTTLTRRDFIETGYINGVNDPVTGEQVIRPLTAEEKAWFSQFISETEHGNFNKNKDVKEAEVVLRELRKDFRYAKRRADVDEMARLFPLQDAQYELVMRLREECNSFYVTDEDRHEIFDRDNERRRDIYNNAKMNDNLTMLDLNEYDKFSTEKCKMEPEAILLERTTKRKSR